MKQISDLPAEKHALSADRLFLFVLWGLLALSVALSFWHDTLFLALRLQRETAAVGASAATLQHTLQTMHASADKVARDMQLITATSNAVASGSSDLSASATAQAARLEQAAQAVDKLTATVKRNVDHAALAN